MTDLRQGQEHSEDANRSPRSEEAALLPMLGEGWEAIGDGIYRFVGRRDEPASPAEPNRHAESPVEEVSADAAHAEPAKRQRKQKHVLPWR
jgi:hypothetical protein